MKVLWYITVLTNASLLNCTPSHEAGSLYTFQRIFSSYGAARLGSSWITSSAGVCAARSMGRYANTGSFMFNPETKLCTPGGHLDPDAPPPSSFEGDLYVQVEPPPKFTITSHGTIQACTGFFNKNVTYQVAATICRSLGYFLVSVKNLDKLMMLKDFSGGHSFWIGCNDMDNEGQFVWEEDGSELKNDMIKKLFGPGEPNNKGNQDCCRYKDVIDRMDDMECTELYPFVCEAALGSC